MKANNEPRHDIPLILQAVGYMVSALSLGQQVKPDNANQIRSPCSCSPEYGGSKLLAGTGQIGNNPCSPEKPPALILKHTIGEAAERWDHSPGYRHG